MIKRVSKKHQVDSGKCHRVDEGKGPQGFRTGLMKEVALRGVWKTGRPFNTWKRGKERLGTAHRGAGHRRARVCVGNSEQVDSAGAKADGKAGERDDG